MAIEVGSNPGSLGAVILSPEDDGAGWQLHGGIAYRED